MQYAVHYSLSVMPLWLTVAVDSSCHRVPISAHWPFRAILTRLPRIAVVRVPCSTTKYMRSLTGARPTNSSSCNFIAGQPHLFRRVHFAARSACEERTFKSLNVGTRNCRRMTILIIFAGNFCRAFSVSVTYSVCERDLCKIMRSAETARMSLDISGHSIRQL